MKGKAAKSRAIVAPPRSTKQALRMLGLLMGVKGKNARIFIAAAFEVGLWAGRHGATRAVLRRIRRWKR